MLVDIHRVRSRTLDSQTSLFGFLLLPLTGISQLPNRGISIGSYIRSRVLKRQEEPPKYSKLHSHLGRGENRIESNPTPECFEATWKQCVRNQNIV
jgi:hypothetical protein